MKRAADFRRIARDCLSGRWGIAIITGLIAGFLGAGDSGGSSLDISFNFEYGADVQISMFDRVLFSTTGQVDPLVEQLLFGGAIALVIAALAFGIAFFVVSSVVRVGYSRFNLEILTPGRPSVETLFTYFPHWLNIICTKLLCGLYVALWSLLLFIPGILAAYSYSMADYILAECPTLSASEALRRSKQMMKGNRWRLFCLQLSFWGWGLLCLLTFGIGYLWLTPYTQAATAAFYREISAPQVEYTAGYTEPAAF